MEFCDNYSKNLRRLSRLRKLQTKEIPPKNVHNIKMTIKHFTEGRNKNCQKL